jgi:hypothetical protein
MPRLNRSEICAADEIQALHLINRCVRRTYRCGKDRRSGKDYSDSRATGRTRRNFRVGYSGFCGAQQSPPRGCTDAARYREGVGGGDC